MSGIAGIIRFDGGPVEPGLVERMTGAMSYRGPDGIHHWTKGSVALGHCMLHTTPESLEETQPLANEDESLVLVMDGWLSNWEELRRELLACGAKLRTHADAELVLRAYEQWGRECLGHIDGEFAFAVWDHRAGELLCATDHAGLKPFYYHFQGAAFVFASELSAVLAGSRIVKVGNEGLVAEYIAHEWHTQEQTAWHGILRVLPAHSLRVSRSKTCSQRYWLPDLNSPLLYKREHDYVAHYRDLLADCVRCASRSHRPVAFELSGGLDSSGVLATAAQLQRSGQMPGAGIETFTFANDDDQGELSYARTVAKHLGLALHEVPQFIPSLGWISDYAKLTCDFPDFPNTTLAAGLYREMLTSGCRVSVGGDGGDEWLTGSRSYYAEFLRRRDLSGMIKSLRADVRVFGIQQSAYWLTRNGFAETMPATGFRALARTAKALRAVLVRRDPDIPPSDDLFWLSDELQQQLDQRRGMEAAHVWASSPVHRQQLATLFNPYLKHAIEHAERLSSVHMIERRSPMWNRRFVQFAFSTGERLRLRENTKHVHREALRGSLPSEIVERADKTDYSPIFRRQLIKAESVLIDSLHSLPTGPWIQPAGVKLLFNAFLRGNKFCWPMWPLWGIYSSYILAGVGASDVMRDTNKEDADRAVDRERGCVQASHVRRSYSTPKLLVFGSVRELTRNGMGSGADGGSAGMTMMSDPRLKQNVVEVGRHPRLGIGLYLFDYLPEYRDACGHGRQFGVMADEVERVMRAAVSLHANGYKQVDYAMLGIAHP